MPLDGKNYLDGTPHAVYTYVANDGVNINIDSGLLRDWTVANMSQLEIQLAPIEEAIALSFITENVIDYSHLLRVLAMPKWDPIIFGHDGTYQIPGNGGPNVIHIDGHHRYFGAYVMGVPSIPCVVLTPEQWEPFRIVGLPQQTREQLIAAPVAKTLGYKR